MSQPLQYDDAYILDRIQAGDEYFFNLLFKKYRNRLFAYLFKITKSKEVAEETVLDVFLKLWHGREAITEIENFERFIFKVAYNKAIDFIRSVKSNPLIIMEVRELMQAIADDRADKQILHENLQAALTSGMALLSPQRQKVFYLRHYEGLSYGEIADQMHLSVNTVRNHLTASIQFIRTYLNKEQLLLLIMTFFTKINF
jgi:RNA polymerase sigma-70 factor, Bacteroides expansion family 1